MCWQGVLQATLHYKSTTILTHYTHSNSPNHLLAPLIVEKVTVQVEEHHLHQQQDFLIVAPPLPPYSHHLNTCCTYILTYIPGWQSTVNCENSVNFESKLEPKKKQVEIGSERFEGELLANWQRDAPGWGGSHSGKTLLLFLFVCLLVCYCLVVCLFVCHCLFVCLSLRSVTSPFYPNRQFHHI